MGHIHKLFYVTQPLCCEIARGETTLTFALTGVGEAGPSVHTLYISTLLELNLLIEVLSPRGTATSLKVLSDASAENFLTKLTLYQRLCCPEKPLRQHLATFSRNRPIRIAFITTFGAAYGDTLIFLTVLREIAHQLSTVGIAFSADLLHKPLLASVHKLAMSSGLLNAAHDLPMPVSRLLDYDLLFELSAESVSDRLPLIDGLLEAAGIEYKDVPSYRKRNHLDFDSRVVAKLGPFVKRAKESGRPLLLFHPFASTPIRSFPQWYIEPFLRTVLERTDYVIVSANEIDFDNGRFISWANISRPFDAFAYLISQCDAFISVDTSTYHVADAFDVPGVTLFTTNIPDRYVCYYPFIVGTRLPGSECLSRVRWIENQEDREYAHSLWKDLDIDYVVTLLNVACKRRPRQDSISG